MQGYPTVVLISMHPHTVEYAGLPHLVTRLQYMHSPQWGETELRDALHGYTRILIRLVMRDLSSEVSLSTNAKQQS
jgi:hypothetical protein